MRLPVFVADWQIESDLDPFSVGDTVSWGLVFEECDDSSASLSREVIDLPAVASTGQAWEGLTFQRAPVVLRVGSATDLYWHAPTAVQGKVQVRGRIREDHHADLPFDHPRATGVIEEIWLVTRTYVAVGGPHWMPRDEPPTYSAITTAPKWLHSPQDLEVRPVQVGEVRPVQVGVLVSLIVPD